MPVTALVVILVGGFVTVANWVILYDRLVRGRFSSWMPLVGGGGLALGFATSGCQSLAAGWWVPLLLDWGCLPGFAHMAWHHLVARRR
jgi:hypothetical protein